MNYPMLDYDVQKLEYHLKIFNEGVDLYCIEDDRETIKQLSDQVSQTIKQLREGLVGKQLNN